MTPAVPFSGKLPPVLLIPVANFPPVSLIPVVHLDSLISPWIFEKIWNDPNVIFRGLGEGDLWKKPKEKISWHCPFKGIQKTLTWLNGLIMGWVGMWNHWFKNLLALWS
jgi:hypothetical protein